MIKNLNLLFAGTFLVILIFFPITVQAQFSFFDGVPPSCRVSGNCTASDFTIIIANISKWLVGISAALALSFFIIGGAMFLFSGGNQNAIDRGKRIIKGTLIGLALILLSWVIVNFIIVALTGNEAGTIFGQPWYKIMTAPITGSQSTGNISYFWRVGSERCGSEWDNTGLADPSECLNSIGPPPNPTGYECCWLQQ